MNFKLSILVTSLILAACSSTPPQPAAGSQTSAGSQGIKTVVAASPTESETQAAERIIKALASSSVYFDYDKFTVKTEFQDLLKKNFDLMKSNPKLVFVLEGHADERGTAEYNLALGQKRAEAVRKTLTLLGVPEAQLEAISFGSEKPRASCHEEKCWADNRRVDFSSKNR